VLGLRVEHWTATNGLTQSAFAGATSAGNCDAAVKLCTIDHADRSKTWVSPKAALGWQAGEDWVLKGSVGRAVRLPTVSELYQGGVNAQGITINNNPDLKPERSVTSELSSEWSFAASALRTTLFYETTRDALYSLLNTATNQSNIQNVDHVRTRGIETAFNAQNVAVRGVDLQGSLTYTDSKVVESTGFVKVPGDVVGKDQIRVPRWRASLLATWRVNDKLSTSLGARYGSKQFSTLDNSDPNGFAYTASSKYATADWRARYQFDKQWSLAVGVDNLNGYTYWNFHPYPQRSYSAELKFDL
jgi:iron complex outermembrane receptor protein